MLSSSEAWKRRKNGNPKVHTQAIERRGFLLAFFFFISLMDRSISAPAGACRSVHLYVSFAGASIREWVIQQ